MRICRLTWIYPNKEDLTYGLGPNFYYISREQAKLGGDVHVICPAHPFDKSFQRNERVSVHRVGFPYNLSAMRKLVDLHRDEPVDLVHAHGTCGIMYPALRVLMKRPLVVHVHGTTIGSRKRYFGEGHKEEKKRPRIFEYESISLLRQRYFWNTADLLIAVSEAVRQELRDFYRIDDAKIAVVKNGIDPETFRPIDDTSAVRREIGIKPDRRIILYVGHFGPRKGLPLLLVALPLILNRIPNAYLLAVGGVPEWLGPKITWGALEQSIRKRGIAGSVKLLDRVQHHSLPSFYSMAEVFAMPSYYEAFPKVVLEAMACETSVVGTKTGGIPEIVEHGTSGLLAEPGNATDLASKILELLQNKTKAHRMGVEARRRVIGSFTWEQTAKNIQKAYQMVV